MPTFNVQHTITCPTCGCALIYAGTKAVVHPNWPDTCPNRDKIFKAPTIDLPEVTIGN